MRKFLTFFLTALLAFGVGWASEVTDVLEVYDFITNWTSTAYQTKSGVQRNSNAVYTGTVARGESQANPSIQLRKNNDDSGIVTTTSGGKVKSVTIEFNSFLTTTRSANIFGKNSAYSQPTDLWSANTKGTQLGSISSASTANKTLTIDGEYEYIGIASSSGTIYIDKITIVWEVPDAGAPTLNVTPTSLTITDPTGDDNSGTITATVENTTNAITYEATTGWSADVSGNKVYYNDKALSANGTITYKCDGASNVPVTVNYNYTGPLYIIGTVNNGTWAPNNYVQLSKGDDGLYTVTLTTAAGNEGMSWISFTKRIANDNDDYAWAYIAPYRFSPMGETVNTDWWLNDQTINKFNALDFNPDHAGKQAIRMEPGEYKITINPATNEFKIEKILGEVTYQKVMSTSDVTSGNYLIVYEGENVALDGSLETLDATGNTQGITIENDKITTNQPIWFTYDASAKTLKSYSGFFIGHTGTKNTLNQSATFSDNYVNNITIANGNALITIPKDNYELKYNATSGQDRFRYFSSGNSQQAVQLYKEYDPNRVATPTFLPAAGTYHKVQTVTISCATDGATIYYSTDGGTTWNEGNSVPVNVTTTIQAKATKQGMTDSHIATATYVIDLPASVNTISAVNALETGKDFVFNNQAVVVYRKGNQMWIQDYNPTAGGALVYGQNLTFEAEDVLAVGWTGTTNTNSGNKQIINLVAQIDNENTPKKPVAIPRTSLSADNEQEYVLLEGVTISDDLKITLDTRGEVVLYPTKFGLYNGFEPQEGVTYDVKGIFDIYGETYEIYPLEITPNQVDPGLAFAKESVEVYVGQVPENALTPEGLTVNYSSTNTAVATVNATTGEVTTVGPGTTTITAIFSGNNEYLADTASYTLTVLAKKAAGLSYGEEAVVINAKVGDAIEEPELANPNDLTVTYESSDTTVAKVDNAGNVTIVGAGTATITAKSEATTEYLAGEASYSIKVTKKDAGLSFNDAEYTKYVGDLSFEGQEVNNPNELTVTYSSSNINLAMVDETDGTVVIGDEPGDVTIYAISAETETFLPDTASYVIHIIAKMAPELSYEQTEFTAKAGGEFEAPELVNPHNLSPITYKSSDENVAAFVDGELVIGEAGTVTITALFAGNGEYKADSASYTITVTKNVAELKYEPNAYTITDGDEFTKPTLTNTANLIPIKYSSSDEEVAMVDENTGKVVLMGKIGSTRITAAFEGNGYYEPASAFYTLTVNPKPVVLEVEPTSLTMSAVVGQEPATATFMVSGENLRGDITLTMNSYAVFSIDPTTISKDNAIGEVTVIYTPTQAGTDNATITITTEGLEEAVTVTVTGTATVPEVVATPTFSLVSGSYTGAQTVIINCATEDATIKYSTDGGNSWNEGNTVNVDKDMTIQVMAEKDGMTASTATATYIIDIPEVKPTMEPFDGYFKVMNNGNQKFVNVAGRKTITFANEANIDKMAGTVVYLKTDEHGQVQSLRSQAADLQGYADRAMRYVPELVELAINKLHAEGVGEILGEHGYDEIMEKFNESFDHHLYVEAAEGGYRLYGKTPSMQPVVDFYREHTHQVEAKLPQLEAFINSAIEKVLEKTGGRGASILQPFSLHETWQRMGGTLTEPVDEASTMAFYREVLNNKNYVWDFAYETAMTYWERLKDNQTFIDNKDKLGEFAQYLDKIEDVRPDFKYYIVQENNKIDYISEGNVDIKTNQPRTAWTLTPRDKFTVNFASNMTMDDRLYYTTLYTDFAYSMPEGVKAYKVTEVNENGVGAIEALEGTIPAQTPVLLKSNAAGDVELTIAAAGDADVTGNLLVGADYFINTYQIKTPQVEGLFNMAATLFGENSTFYQELLTKYGHLMLKTSGTVHNKYFWALTNDDLNQCVVQNELGEQDCVVRTLDKDEDGIGFYGEWKAPANQAFLASDKFNPVKLLLGKDVTRDGLWNVADVTATISIILETAPEGNNYDLDAADFDNNGRINVADVTAMIAYILGKVN